MYCKRGTVLSHVITSSLRPDVPSSSSSPATFLLLSKGGTKRGEGGPSRNLISLNPWEPAFSSAPDLKQWLWLVKYRVNHGYYGIWLYWCPSEEMIFGEWEQRTRFLQLVHALHVITGRLACLHINTAGPALESWRSYGTEKKPQNPP